MGMKMARLEDKSQLPFEPVRGERTGPGLLDSHRAALVEQKDANNDPPVFAVLCELLFDHSGCDYSS
jgi:hypothetical protein